MAYINDEARKRLEDVELRKVLFPEIKDPETLSKVNLSDVVIRLVEKFKERGTDGSQ